MITHNGGLIHCEQVVLTMKKISLEPPLIALLIKFIKTIKIVKEFQKYSIQSKAKQLPNCPPKTVYTNVSAFYGIKSPKMLGITKKVGKKRALLSSSHCELFPKMLVITKKVGIRNSAKFPAFLHSSKSNFFGYQSSTKSPKRKQRGT